MRKGTAVGRSSGGHRPPLLPQSLQGPECSAEQTRSSGSSSGKPRSRVQEVIERSPWLGKRGQAQKAEMPRREEAHSENLMTGILGPTQPCSSSAQGLGPEPDLGLPAASSLCATDRSDPKWDTEKEASFLCEGRAPRTLQGCKFSLRKEGHPFRTTPSSKHPEVMQPTGNK